MHRSEKAKREPEDEMGWNGIGIQGCLFSNEEAAIDMEWCRGAVVPWCRGAVVQRALYLRM